MKTNLFQLTLLSGLFLLPQLSLLAQKSTAPSQESKTAEDYYDRGRDLESHEKYREAVDSYTAAIRLDTADPRAYVGRGDAHCGLKDYRRAISDYDKAIGIYSSWGPKKNREGSGGITIGELDSVSFKAELEIGLVYFKRGAAKSSLGNEVGGCEDFHESCKWDEVGCAAFSNSCDKESVKMPIGPRAQKQSVTLGLEGTRWDGVQPEEAYSPALDESLTREFDCTFGRREVSCKVRIMAGSRVRWKRYVDPITNRLESRQELVPQHLLGWEEKNGTYELSGNHIHIDLAAAYGIDGTVKGKNMEGEITLKLESNQKARWVASKRNGEQQ